MGDNSKQKQHSGTVLVGAIKQEGASAKEHTELTQVQPKLEMSDNGRAKSTTTCATELDSQSHPNSSYSKGGRPVTSDTIILKSISEMLHTVSEKTNELNDMLSAEGHEICKSILEEITSLQSKFKDKVNNNKDKHSIVFPFMKDSDIYVCFESACFEYAQVVDRRHSNIFTADLSTIVHDYVKSCRDLASETQDSIQKLLGEYSINITTEFLSPFQLNDVKNMTDLKFDLAGSSSSSNASKESKNTNTMFLVFPFITVTDIKKCFKHILDSITALGNKSTGTSVEAKLAPIQDNYITECHKFHSDAEGKIKILAGKYSITLKIHESSPFELKDVEEVLEPEDKLTRANVVYRFTCAAADCTKTYIGMTEQELSKGINGHRSNNSSSVTQHSVTQHHKCKSCKAAYENLDIDDYKETCYEVIDSAINKQQLKIKKALHIMWQHPTINKQTQHRCLTLTY